MSNTNTSTSTPTEERAPTEEPSTKITPPTAPSSGPWNGSIRPNSNAPTRPPSRATTKDPSVITDAVAAPTASMDLPTFYDYNLPPTASTSTPTEERAPTNINIVTGNDYGYNNSNSSNNSSSSARAYSPSFTAFIIIAFIVLFLTRLWQIHKERQSIRRNNENNGNNVSPPGGGGGDGTTNNNHEITDSGLKFTLKDRIELYNKTFDSNGNQLILQDKHIKTKAKSTSANDDDGNVENNSDVFIDIELADTAERVENDNDDDDDDASSIYLSVESERRLTRTHLDSTRSLCLDLDLQKDNNTDNKDKEKKQMISGTCIICFEEFMKNDVIVWSQDSKCGHVYHKECMVNYLASNAQRKINSTLNVHDNPCPTCRQNYCTVTDEDLVKQMISNAAAASSSSTITSSSSITLSSRQRQHIITTATTTQYAYPMAMTTTTTMPDVAVAVAEA
jgi:hypothetical protein